MSNPTNGGPFDARVMVEVMIGGVPRRVNVWTFAGRTYVSFVPGLSEADAVSVAARGLGLLQGVDMRTLFREPTGKVRRFIDVEDCE